MANINQLNLKSLTELQETSQFSGVGGNTNIDDNNAFEMKLPSSEELESQSDDIGNLTPKISSDDMQKIEDNMDALKSQSSPENLKQASPTQIQSLLDKIHTILEAFKNFAPENEAALQHAEMIAGNSGDIVQQEANLELYLSATQLDSSIDTQTLEKRQASTTTTTTENQTHALFEAGIPDLDTNAVISWMKANKGKMDTVMLVFIALMSYAYQQVGPQMYDTSRSINANNDAANVIHDADAAMLDLQEIKDSHKEIRLLEAIQKYPDKMQNVTAFLQRYGGLDTSQIRDKSSDDKDAEKAITDAWNKAIKYVNSQAKHITGNDVSPFALKGDDSTFVDSKGNVVIPLDGSSNENNPHNISTNIKQISTMGTNLSQSLIQTQSALANIFSVAMSGADKALNGYKNTSESILRSL